VVVHEAISEEGESVFSSKALDEPEIKFFVIFGEKHLLAAIASLGDMVGATGDDKPGELRHFFYP